LAAKKIMQIITAIENNSNCLLAAKKIMQIITAIENNENTNLHYFDYKK
jgi:hypothetical protein